MRSRLVHISSPESRFPDPVVIDTNLLVARFLTAHQQRRAETARVASLFGQLLSENRQVVLTPTVYAELLHTSIRLRFQWELRHNRHAITARFGSRMTSWTELYKRDASLLTQHSDELERLRLSLLQSGIMLLVPEELGPIPSGSPYHEELVRLIHRYSLDTTDSLILMEASRLGISSIVTMDRDMERALPDFDVYLWR